MKNYSTPEILLVAVSTDDVLTESVSSNFVDSAGVDNETKIKWWKTV